MRITQKTIRKRAAELARKRDAAPSQIELEHQAYDELIAERFSSGGVQRNQPRKRSNGIY